MHPCWGCNYNYIHCYTIIGPPKFITTPSDEMIVNGSNVTFVCEGVGDPQHDVSWTFNGSLIASTTIDIIQSSKYSLYRDKEQLSSYGSLTILNADFSDGGIYQCFLNNTVGTINSSVSLTVNGMYIW